MGFFCQSIDGMVWGTTTTAGTLTVTVREYGATLQILAIDGITVLCLTALCSLRKVLPAWRVLVSTTVGR